MELKVIKIKDGINKNWDDIDFENECVIVEKFKGETNGECEEKAMNAGFGDSELYGWTYGEV